MTVTQSKHRQQPAEKSTTRLTEEINERWWELGRGLGTVGTAVHKSPLETRRWSMTLPTLRPAPSPATEHSHAWRSTMRNIPPHHTERGQGAHLPACHHLHRDHISRTPMAANSTNSVHTDRQVGAYWAPYQPHPIKLDRI